MNNKNPSWIKRKHAERARKIIPLNDTEVGRNVIITLSLGW